MEGSTRERMASTGRPRVPGWMSKLHGTIFADARQATARSRITVEPPNEEIPAIIRNFARRTSREGETAVEEAFDMVDAADALEELSDSSGDESQAFDRPQRDSSGQMRSNSCNDVAPEGHASVPDSSQPGPLPPESIPGTSQDDGGSQHAETVDGPRPRPGAEPPTPVGGTARPPSLLRRVGRSLQSKVRRAKSPSHAVLRYQRRLLLEAAREEATSAQRDEEVGRVRGDLIARAEALGKSGLPHLRDLQRTVTALSLQRLRIQARRAEAAANALRARAAAASDLAESLAALQSSQTPTPASAPTPAEDGAGESRAQTRWRPRRILSRFRGDSSSPAATPEGGSDAWERATPLLRLGVRDVVAADPRVSALDRALSDTEALLGRFGADLERRMRHPDPKDAVPSVKQVLTRAEAVWRRRRDRSTFIRLANAEKARAEGEAAAIDRRRRRRHLHHHQAAGDSGCCCPCCPCQAAAAAAGAAEGGSPGSAGATCVAPSPGPAGASAGNAEGAAPAPASPPLALECMLLPDVHANRLRRAGRAWASQPKPRRVPDARKVLARQQRLMPSFSDAWEEGGPPDVAAAFEAVVFDFRTHIGRLLQEWVWQMLRIAKSSGEAPSGGGEGEEGEEGDGEAGLAGQASPANALPPPGTLVAFLRYVADLVACECSLAREDSRRVPLLLLLESTLLTRVQPLIWRYNASALARKDAVWWRCQAWARVSLSPHALGVEPTLAGAEPWDGRPLFPRASLALAAMVVAPTPMRQLRQLMNAVRLLMREGAHRAVRAHAPAPTFDAESLFPCLVHALVCADCYHIHAALCAIELLALPFADIVASQADTAADAALRNCRDMDAAQRREWVDLGESASEASYYATALTAAVAWVMERGIEAGVDGGGGDAGGAIPLREGDGDSSHAVLSLPTASPTDKATERQATRDMAAWVDHQRTMDHLVQSLSL